MSADANPDGQGGLVARFDRPDRSDAVLVVGYLLAVWAVMALTAFLVGGDANLAANFIARVTVLVGAYALLTLALNIQWGYTGLFNIGVAGFMAVGAYTTAILSAPLNPGTGGVPGFGLPLPVAMVGGMVMAALVGAVAALPALRLKADYLAIVTVALSEIIRLFVNWQGVERIRLFGKALGTGGGTGISFPAPNGFAEWLVAGPLAPLVAAVESLGVSQGNVATLTYGLVLLVFVLLAYVVLDRLSDSPFGRVLKAIREDEEVTQSLGKDTRLFKVKAFMIGCALMGLAGVLFRGQAGYVSPNQFRPVITFYAFAALIVGGSGSNTGSVIGAATFTAFLFYLPARVGQEISVGTQVPGNILAAIAGFASLDPTPFVAYALANVSDLRFVAIGVVLVYIIQNRPEGLLGHRIEPAASVSLERPAQQGGEGDE